MLKHDWILYGDDDFEPIGYGYVCTAYPLTIPASGSGTGTGVNPGVASYGSDC